MNANETIRASTLAEYDEMAGHPAMQVRTLEQVRTLARHLGYRMDTEPSRTCAIGRYTNRGNARHYLAYGISWTDMRTGKGFAHVDADRSRLPELQELRASTACLYMGRIVEF